MSIRPSFKMTFLVGMSYILRNIFANGESIKIKINKNFAPNGEIMSFKAIMNFCILNRLK